MIERFREPPPHLPRHARAFVRLIATAPGHVFCTWEVPLAASQSSATLRVHGTESLTNSVDEGALQHAPAVAEQRVSLADPGFFLRVPDERLVCVAALHIDDTHTTLWSNATVLVPSRVGPEGPLWWAHLDVRGDRRFWRRGALWATGLVRDDGTARARTDLNRAADAFAQDTPFSSSLVRR
jgi:hypothetical protein